MLPPRIISRNTQNERCNWTFWEHYQTNHHQARREDDNLTSEGSVGQIPEFAHEPGVTQLMERRFGDFHHECENTGKATWPAAIMQDTPVLQHQKHAKGVSTAARGAGENWLSWAAWNAIERTSVQGSLLELQNGHELAVSRHLTRYDQYFFLTNPVPNLQATSIIRRYPPKPPLTVSEISNRAPNLPTKRLHEMRVSRLGLRQGDGGARGGQRYVGLKETSLASQDSTPPSMNKEQLSRLSRQRLITDAVCLYDCESARTPATLCPDDPSVSGRGLTRLTQPVMSVPTLVGKPFLDPCSKAWERIELLGKCLGKVNKLSFKILFLPPRRAKPGLSGNFWPRPSISAGR